MVIKAWSHAQFFLLQALPVLWKDEPRPAKSLQVISGVGFKVIFSYLVACSSTWKLPSLGLHMHFPQGPAVGCINLGMAGEVLRGQEHLPELSVLSAGAQHLSAHNLTESLSPTISHWTEGKGDKEWREISMFWRKSSGHQRTPHSQNSSITLARLVCLVNLVFSPYNNTVFGKQTAGTALTSCSSIFYNNSSTDITLNLFFAPSPVLRSLQLQRKQTKCFLSVTCPVTEEQSILITYCRQHSSHVQQ